MTMSSMFGAEKRISKRSSARAVHTRRHTRATQNVWRGARVDRKCNAGRGISFVLIARLQSKCPAGLTRSGSMTQSMVYNSMTSRALIAHANGHNFLCKIGDGENILRKVHKYLSVMYICFLWCHMVPSSYG